MVDSKLAVVIVAVSLLGCAGKHVETRSSPVEVAVRLGDTCGGAASVERYIGATRGWVAVVPTDDRGRYKLRFESMRGGGTRGNIHDPSDYENLRIRLAGEVVATLSINDVRSLPKDADGSSVVAISCPEVAADGFELRGEVAAIRGLDRELASVEIAWIGEASHGDRRAAIVWPALLDGRVIDNDVIAVVFAKSGGTWTLEGAEIGPKPPVERIEEALGGPFVLARPDGPTADEFGPHVLATALAFQEALAAGNSSAAITAFESYARAFGPNMLIHDNDGVNLIIGGRLAKLETLVLRDIEASGDTANASLVGVEGGREVPVSVRLIRSGEGWAIDRLEP